MPRFQFQVIDAAHSARAGVMDAANHEEARRRLAELGYRILSLKKTAGGGDEPLRLPRRSIVAAVMLALLVVGLLGVAGVRQAPPAPEMACEVEVSGKVTPPPPDYSDLELTVEIPELSWSATRRWNALPHPVPGEYRLTVGTSGRARPGKAVVRLRKPGGQPIEKEFPVASWPARLHWDPSLEP